MTTDFTLTPLAITRPEKILWRQPKGVQDALSCIQSASLRSFLQTADTTLHEAEITTEYRELDEASFKQWLPYYQEKMAENNYDVIASVEWFQEKLAAGQQVFGIFFSKNNQLVGSCIITIKKDGNTKRGTMAFKASDRINLSNKQNSSLGSLIDFLFIQKMISEHIDIISAGKSRNAFGVFNTVGYLEYKLRFGYIPQPSTTDPLTDSVPLPESGVVLFYGLQNNNLTLYALKPKNQESNFQFQKFATPGLPFAVLEY